MGAEIFESSSMKTIKLKPKNMILRKLWSLTKWLLVMQAQGLSYGIITVYLLLLYWIFGWQWNWSSILLSLITTSWVMYPIVYPFRSIIRRLKGLLFPFWIYLDDTEKHDYGPAWFLKAKGLKIDTWLQRFIASYLWSAVRNPTWNIQSLFKVKSATEHTITLISWKGELYKNGKIYSNFATAGFKYVDKDGKYMDNSGPFLSVLHSVLGKMFIWTEIDGTLYWRFSKAKISKGKHWWEFQLGHTSKRYTLRIKHYTDLVIYEKMAIDRARKTQQN